MNVPGLVTSTRTPRRFLIDEYPAPEPGGTVVIDSGNTDAGNTPTSLFSEGNVIVLRTSTGRFVEANDSNGDVFTPPVVSSAEAADTDWDGTTLTFYLNGDLVATVVLAGSDDSTSEVVTALETAFLADQIPLVASGLDAAVLVVTAHVLGSLRVESTLATAFATAGGAGSYAEDNSTDPLFLVTRQPVLLLTADGTAAAHKMCDTCWKGHFSLAGLTNLTAAARAVLERRGSRFSA